MPVAEVLSAEASEALARLLAHRYGCDLSLGSWHVVCDRAGRLFLVSRDVDVHRFLSDAGCHRLGLYFGKHKRNDKIKLTIEGALMVGRTATRNYVVVDGAAASRFMAGGDVSAFRPVDAEMHDFVLVRSGEDTLGCGLLREGCIENLVRTSRRVARTTKEKGGKDAAFPRTDSQ
jgi:NOL1/NOP2/fmu family ribosome biogenesis protein